MVEYISFLLVNKLVLYVSLFDPRPTTLSIMCALQTPIIQALEKDSNTTLIINFETFISYRLLEARLHSHKYRIRD